MENHPAPPRSPGLRFALRRRDLLAALGGAALAGVLIACEEPRRQDRTAGTSPAAAHAPAAAAGVSPLDNFLYLSYLLTGVDQVFTTDATVAQAYMNALQPPSGTAGLDDLYALAGIGTTGTVTSLQELQQRGVFDRPDTRTLTERVLTCWYTGIVDAPAGPSVVTYTDALAWTTLGFTGPPGSCAGVLGFWSSAP